MPNHGAATGQRYNFLIAATLTESIFKPVSLDKKKITIFFYVSRSCRNTTKCKGCYKNKQFLDKRLVLL